MTSYVLHVLQRAGTMESYKLKAWAMRDTFDGLINAFGRWCEKDAEWVDQLLSRKPPE